MVRKFPPFRSERKKRSTSEGTPQFPNGISGKLPYHLTPRASNRNFRIFWPNGKHPQTISYLSLSSRNASTSKQIYYGFVYYGLVSCIKLLRKCHRSQNETNRNFSTSVENFIKSPKPNRLAYKKLVSAKQSSPRKSQRNGVPIAVFSATRQSTGRWLTNYHSTALKLPNWLFSQFKLLYRRLATNDFLNKIGIRENDICTFCRTEKESLFHLFWSCSETSCFWQGFMKWLAENQIKLKSEIFTLDLIISLRSDTLDIQHKAGLYFLVPRCYIWSCRIKEVLPKIERFPSFLSSLVPFDS